MASAIASEGTLRIHRSIAGTSAPFRVTYQALSAMVTNPLRLRSVHFITFRTCANF